MAKAVFGDTVIAEAPHEELIQIEGNWYFPPSSIQEGFLVDSPTPYNCPWKGDCQYFSLKDGDQLLQDRAWTYPEPYESGIARVGKDFGGYVAFWKEVQVVV